MRPGQDVNKLADIVISIHAPRVGCDASKLFVSQQAVGFQSTHPVWGATPTRCNFIALKTYFNPRTPCGVRRGAGKGRSRGRRISIHAPRVGCDLAWVGGSTYVTVISIHAPRVGCDENPFGSQEVGAYFNPRTPCGVRRSGSGGSADAQEFQSTHPVWGATWSNPRWRRVMNISIHAPRVGCDGSGSGGSADAQEFQSTHPVWGATGGGAGGELLLAISIHAPRVGCDSRARVNRYDFKISIHAPRVGCDGNPM